MDVVLVHVSGTEIAAAQGALAGLFGRGRRGPDPAAQIDALSAEAAEDLLDRAAGQLGRPATTEHRTGRVERELVNAAEGASLLICARDGEVGHEPCPTKLLWTRVQGSIVRTLSDMTLADLTRSPTPV